MVAPRSLIAISIFLACLRTVPACGDSAGPSRSPTPAPAPSVRAAVWTLAPTANGFQWVSPGGTSVLCKFAGVSMVDSLNLTRAGQDVNVVPNKYPTWAAWAQVQSNRLMSWGFNAAGQYSEAFMNPPNYPSGGLPVEVVAQVSGHAKRDDNR